MKIVLVLTAVVLSLLASSALAAFCTVSGDPHWKTFGGALHDFQGEGVWQQVYHSAGLIDIQTQHLPCNSPHKVTCLRSTAIKIGRYIPFLRQVVYTNIKWGIFYNPVVDPLTVDDVEIPKANCTRGCNIPLGSSFDNRVATLTFNGATLTIQSPNAVNVTVGRFYLQVALPETDVYTGMVNGLCGTLDSESSNDFTYPNGTLAFASNAGSRYNGAKVNAWASTFAVGAQFAPLARTFKQFDVQSNTEFEVQDVPAPIIPTDEEQAELDAVNFIDPENIVELEDRCLALYPAAGPESPSVRNCIYDAATLPDLFGLAASNQIAQASADAQLGLGGGSSSGLNRDQIIGLSVGLGFTGFLAVAIAGLLYGRLRKVTTAYNNALIVRNQSQDQGTSGSTIGSRHQQYSLHYNL